MCLSPESEKVFLDYKWHGNVRELENLIQSLVVIADKGYICVTDLPKSMVSCQSQQNFRDSYCLAESLSLENKSLSEIMNEVEKELLEKLLATHDGSIAALAIQLKVDRTTIFRKLKKHQLI